MGRTPEFSDYEEMLLDYVFTRRRARLIVNVRNIVETLIQMIPEELRKPYDRMRQWVYRFLDRNRLTIRRITRNVSLDDVELQRRATVFLDEVREICIGNPNVIFINMDQTAVYYNEQHRTTVDPVGTRNVTVSASPTSDRVTAALTVASNGDKLIPLVIFKGTEDGRVARSIRSRNSPFPTGLFYAVQAHAWMDERVMFAWLEDILFPYVERVGPANVCLVLDTLRSHRTQEVLRRIQAMEVRLLFIPGGLTGHLQPLDVGINGPLKHWLRQASLNEADEANHDAESRRVAIARRVLDCWNLFEVGTIRNSFNHMLVGSIGDREDFDEVE